MTQFRSRLTLAILLLAFTASVHAQEAGKVLEIERYADEPVQLVDLRIGTQSVKDVISRKFRDEKSNVGLDRVSFNEADDWFTRISITLRNTSTRPVYGLRAYLYLKFAGQSVLYGMSMTPSRLLRNDPLQPGAEIELMIPPRELNITLENLKSGGLGASQPAVTLSLDAVNFSEELQWSRGTLLRPDPSTPGKWIRVENPAATKQN